MRRISQFLATAALVAGFAGAAEANNFVVYKLGIDAIGANTVIGGAYNGWANNGSFNAGNGTAMSLSNTTLDFKDAWVDSPANWATVTSVHVAFLSGGVEKASMDFSPGPDKLSFFSASNLTGTTYTDLGSFSGNFFSQNGDPGNGRRWFVNQNYGGCGADTGWIVVEDALSGKPCGWEQSNQNATSNREFLYTLNNARDNWNNTVGQADVFAITVTDNAVPEPASMALLAAGVAGMTAARRRRR